MGIDYLTASDSAIQKELGSRLKALRLSRNVTQGDLAGDTGLSRDTISRIENGEGRLVTVVIVLRALGKLDHLDSFIPPIEIDPISIAEMQGKVRQRARGGKK